MTTSAQAAAAIEPGRDAVSGTRALPRFLRDAAARRPGAVAVILAAQVVAMATNLTQPTLNALVIDNGVIAGDLGYVQRMGVVMVAIAVVGLAASLAAVIAGARFASGSVADLRGRVFRKARSLSPETAQRFGTPTLITRTTQDTAIVQQAVFLATSIAITAPVLTIGAIALSLRESVHLSPVIVVTAVVLAVVVGIFVSRATPLSRRLQLAVDTTGRVLREQLSGTRIIRAFRREATESERFGTVNDELTSLSRRIGVISAMLLPAVLIVSNLAGVATTLFGAALIESGDLTIGRLTAFTGYLSQIVVGIVLLVSLTAVIPRAQISAGRVAELLAAPSGVPDDPPDAAGVDGPLQVDFVGVRLRHTDAERPAVDGVTLACVPGRLTAVIGGTASGKSTLLSLVPRLAEPTSGRLVVGGRDARNWPLTGLRGAVAFVGQGPSLLAGTIASNLRVGRETATEPEMWDALTVADAAEFVRGRGGVEAGVAQSGADYSGGQRARLAIARAVLRRPRILVLDDAFAAMDRDTGVRVLAAVRAALPEATIILAVQQISLVTDADVIAVLDKGRLAGHGTHADLLRRSPVYRDIVASQTGGVTRPKGAPA